MDRSVCVFVCNICPYVLMSLPVLNLAHLARVTSNLILSLNLLHSCIIKNLTILDFASVGKLPLKKGILISAAKVDKKKRKKRESREIKQNRNVSKSLD